MRRSFSLLFSIGALIMLLGAGCFQLSTGTDTEKTSGPAGVYRSSDKGESWQAISFVPLIDGVKNVSGFSVYRLEPDPQDPNAIYWASRENGLLYTYDAGRSWQVAPAPLNTGFIYGVSVDPQDKCTVYASTGAQVFRSTDCSRSWERMYTDPSGDRIMDVAVDPFASNHVVMVNAGGAILESTDGGVSWRVLRRFGSDFSDMSPDPLQQGVWYAATKTKGLVRSLDGGETWESLRGNFDGFPGALSFRRFFVYPNRAGVIYWVSDYGILKSEDSGNNWTAFSLTTPPGSAKIYAFGVNPKNENELYYTATIGARSTFYRSIDGGQSWITKKLPTGQIPTAMYIHAANADAIYLGFTIPPKS